MVAFNFQSQFSGKILSGEKRSTIRPTKRCDVGDTMHLYTGQRTKDCNLLLKTRCIGVGQIVIGDIVDGKEVPWQIRQGYSGEVRIRPMPLHSQEGFENVGQFLQFFRNRYTLPFTGWLHVWDYPPKER